MAFIGSGWDQLSAMIGLRKTPIPRRSRQRRPASSTSAGFGRSQRLPAYRSLLLAILHQREVRRRVAIHDIQFKRSIAAGKNFHATGGFGPWIGGR
jgi:hypothetical protein